MSDRGRFVFDTNVLVSGILIKRSLAAQAFDRARSRGEILLSLAAASEINEVLSRKKFERYVSSEDRERFLVALIQTARLVDITERIVACRDPKDDMFLELAASGNATCIVSGDDDLLVLHPFRGIPIVTARQFLQLFR